jgi:predicted enzyme related to lactoylglutathione lyase
MERVIGLGGPFLKVNDPKAMAAWYEKHLGVPFKGNVYADWPLADQKTGSNVLSFFKKDADYFAPSEGPVMINFMVKDLFALLEELKKEGVQVVGEPMSEVYGKFGWILDPEGNKIELWEAPE